MISQACSNVGAGFVGQVANLTVRGQFSNLSYSPNLSFKMNYVQVYVIISPKT
jgi:hypothetical protein